MIRASLCSMLLLSLAFVSPAQAHFIFLKMDEAQPKQVHVYFSESAEPDNPALLDRLEGLAVQAVPAEGKPATLETTKGKESLVATLPEEGQTRAVIVSFPYGVIKRGESEFLLNYRAKTYPAGTQDWGKATGALDLEIVPTLEQGKLHLQAFWKGKPAANIEMSVQTPSFDELSGTTDENGVYTVEKLSAGTLTARAKRVEAEKGEHKGQIYTEARYYSTLTLDISEQSEEKNVSTSPTYPALPHELTSFGAAVLDGSVYVYGGHMGGAHSYSHAEQSGNLYRISLAAPKAWEKLADGPHLQGLALVAHGGKLYRVGGFTAKNAEGEEHDLNSSNSFASYDPKTNKWTDLAPLPAPRSSHDAVVIGDTLYVAGGWELKGKDAESVWHQTAYKLDLSKEKAQWEELPQPPFKRRAVSLGEFQGKLYVIGGMQEKGGPTTAVAVYDPATQKWSEGPKLVGEEAIEGFGTSAFLAQGTLYVSTMKGNLQALSADGTAWTVAQPLSQGRFFHRMLPGAHHDLLLIAGANMQVGKFADVETVAIPVAPKQQ